MNKATKRAEMPKGSNAVLDRRTIYNANKNLLGILKPGQRVLDVGCGSGTITIGICELVKVDGFVIGIDPSNHLIDLARLNFDIIPNLSFELGDINNYDPSFKFDVISSARTLQWLCNPEEVLRKMLKMVKRGGIITILDYNHEKIEWSPMIPESMSIFYNSFLKWRSDAGMDNRIADNLVDLLQKLGLKNITISNQDEITIQDEEDAEKAFDIWTKVAETRGKQLVEDNYISEELRLQAIKEYNSWIRNKAISMKLYMRAVTGYVLES